MDTGWVLLQIQRSLGVSRPSGRGQAKSEMALGRGQAIDPSPLAPCVEGHPES